MGRDDLASAGDDTLADLLGQLPALRPGYRNAVLAEAARRLRPGGRPCLLEAFIPYRHLQPGDILAGDALILGSRPSASGKTVTLTVRTFTGEQRDWPRIKAADKVLVYSRGNPVEPGAPLLLPPDGNTAKAAARRGH